MAVITLTFTPSSDEISSGIPKSVEISSNVPATIYYTLDGSSPTRSSNIYTETIDFPYDINSITLKAFAVDYEEQESSILSQTFAPNTTHINISRIVAPEGKNVNSYADETNITSGYGADGEATSYIDEELYKLHPSYSAQGAQGIAPGTAISVGTPNPEDTSWPFDDNFVPYSTTESAQFFNPYAKVIVMDGRKNNEVNILNRPFGSMRSLTQEFNGVRLTAYDMMSPSYTSGGFVRSFYDKRNNIMVSYYFDHNTCRYVKSIQNLPEIPKIYAQNIYEFPLIFRWINRGRHSTII